VRILIAFTSVNQRDFLNRDMDPTLTCTMQQSQTREMGVDYHCQNENENAHTVAGVWSDREDEEAIKQSLND
jgi:hypothetical protein